MKSESNKFRVAIRAFPPFENTIKKIWRTYCQQTGCDLELELMPFDLHSLYNELLRDGGLKAGIWDAAIINTDFLAEAYESEAVEDLGNMIKKNPPEGFPEDWSDSLLHLQRFNDQIIGIPFHDGPECLIYRKDLFNSNIEQEKYYQNYGKKLEPPRTWDDLRDVSEFFTRPEQDLYGTAFAAYPDGHNTVFDFCIQLWSRGGTLESRMGHIHLNTSEAYEGMLYYRDIIQNRHAVHPDCRQFDSVKTGMEFANGSIALMVNWFGFASMAQVYGESKVKGLMDIATLPGISQNKSISLNNYWLYVLGSGSNKKDLGYDFIRYAVHPSNDKLLTLEGGIGCRKSTWTDKEINTTIPFFHKLIEMHQNAMSLPRRTDWFEISKVIDKMVLEVLNTSKDIRIILENAQSEMERLGGY